MQSSKGGTLHLLNLRLNKAKKQSFVKPTFKVCLVSYYLMFLFNSC